jgi:hypothetical protein
LLSFHQCSPRTRLYLALYAYNDRYSKSILSLYNPSSHMTEMLNFLKEYSSLINTALILSLIGIGFKLFQATIAQKNSEIDVLKERMAIQETFSINNVTERFQALKDYYEKHMREWYESSMKTLEEEKRKAIENKELEFQKRIELEMHKRNELMAQYSVSDAAKQVSHYG